LAKTWTSAWCSTSPSIGVGDLLLLSYKDSVAVITRCNYRGEPIGAVEIANLPAGIRFEPSRMVHRNGLFTSRRSRRPVWW